MAILSNVTIPHTEVEIQGYIKINNILTKKEDDGTFNVTIFVFTYTKEPVPGDGFIQNKRYVFQLDIESSDNSFTQAYNYLKTLPQYADAIDA